VLETAALYPDERVVLVTSDPDFLNDDRSGFHNDLELDLTERGLEERISHAASLADVVLQVAERTPGSKDALRELRAELQDESVRQFVASIAASAARSLDPRRCALPPTTIRAVALQVGPLRNLKYSVKGQSGEAEAVADFSCEADTSVLVTVPTGTDFAGAEQPAVVDEVVGEASYAITKPLVFSGILQLGRYDRPLGGEVSPVAATPDDPGRLQWAALDRLAARYASASAVADVMKQLDWYKNLNVNPIADAMKQLDWYKNLNVNPIADAMKQLDWYKNLNVNPIADAMKQLDWYKNLNIGRRHDEETDVESADSSESDDLPDTSNDIGDNPVADEPKEEDDDAGVSPN
jgi:hypothetical protein